MAASSTAAAAAPREERQAGSPAKRPRYCGGDSNAEGSGGGPRAIRTVGFLGISDYGLGQLEVLVGRYRVAFATAKAKRPKHAAGLDSRLEAFCRERGIEFLGSVNANSEEVVKRARQTDLVVIGGYDRILKAPIIEAPRFGVLNTHLGLLPLNRGCCPTMWAQLHGFAQGYTTYAVNPAIDHGLILDRYEAEASLGCLEQTNREVYDALAAKAVERFGAALDRFEAGEALLPCEGREAYHRQGMPNDSWLSWHWSDTFLRRFSLSLDFHPYLPGCSRVEGTNEPIFLAIEGSAPLSGAAAEAASVGEVLEIEEDTGGSAVVVVRTRQSAVRCRVRKGAVPHRGQRLESLGGVGAHPVGERLEADALPLDGYVVQRPAELPGSG